MDDFHRLPTGDLGVLALGVVIAATVGGLAAGVLGIGAGIVLVPVFYRVMSELGVNADIRMHVAIGTSLAATIPAAVLRSHTNRALIDWNIMQRWTVPFALGAVAGIIASFLLGGRVLALLFAAVAIPLALALAVPGRKERSSSFLETAKQIVLSALIGAASALTGVGGDVAGSVALQRAGVPAAPAKATAAVLALVVALPAVFGTVLLGWNNPDLPPASFGYVNLLGLALSAPLLLLAEFAGTGLAHLVDLKRLRLVFAALIAIVSARMLWDAWM